MTRTQPPRLDPARTIVAKLGGEAAVSEAAKVSASTPFKWQYPRESGGTGGQIPNRYMKPLFDLAKERGVTIELTEWYALEEAEQ